MSKANVFLHVQQNTCSSQIELIPFFTNEHFITETKLISKVIKSKKRNFIIDHTVSVSLSKISKKIIPIQSISLEELDCLTPCCIFLSDPKWINIIFESNIKFNIYVFRHEGDFKISGKDVVCDCNYCLLSTLSENASSYRFSQSLYTDYHNGNQYTVLYYCDEHKLDVEKPPIVMGCKKKPTSLNKTFYGNPITFKHNESKDDPYKYYYLLGSPKYFCAPMIGQSELAFRMFLRECAGVHACYTAMIISNLFLENSEYRNELFTTCKSDRPLAVQFSANDPTTLLNAAKKVEDYCDAIDINFGCPQPTGRRNYYGAWLMEDWSLVYRLIRILKENLKIPVWCKIRIFENVNDTIEYAKMIELAGCSLLTVHGRLRKCHMNDLPANWEQIKKVKESLRIPVIANGSIVSLEEANRCLNFTTCDGVMAASQILKDPFLFSPNSKTAKETALLYLDYAKKYKGLLRYAKPHVMQILGDILDEKTKNIIKLSPTIADIEKTVKYANLTCQNKSSSNSAFNTLFEYT